MARRKTRQVRQESRRALAMALFVISMISAGFWAGALNQFSATAFIGIQMDPCTGPIGFSNMADANTGASVSATWTGLQSGCSSKLVYMKHDTCSGTDVSGASCSMGFDGSGGCNFIAPNFGGTYTYAFCIDINGDGTFAQAGESATNTLHVLGTTCGNGVIDSGEVCDGTNLNGKNCSDAGNFNGGTLKCNAACSAYDTSSCTYTPPPPVTPVCGNWKVEGSEQCDATNLTGKTCTSIGMGFTGGTLKCKVDCTLNTAECTSPPPPANQTALCGNSVVETGEQCDGANLNSQTCIGQGFTGGTLKCTGCRLDTTSCTMVSAADAQAAITAAQNAITTARQAGKNVTAATAQVNAAIASLNSYDYPNAKSQAELAKSMADNAQALPADNSTVLISIVGVIVAAGGAISYYFLKMRPKAAGLAPAPAPE